MIQRFALYPSALHDTVNDEPKDNDQVADYDDIGDPVPLDLSKVLKLDLRHITAVLEVEFVKVGASGCASGIFFNCDTRLFRIG